MNEDKKIFIDAKVHSQIILNNYEIKTSELLRKTVDEVCTMPRYRDINREKLIKILEMENNLPSHHMFNRFSVIFLSRHFQGNKKGWWD
jgi:hypothetical protein